MINSLKPLSVLRRLLLVESIDGVCDLRIDERNACEGAVLLHWEQVHSVQFPEDVKAFYLSSNGFSFSWKFRLCGNGFKILLINFNSNL